MKNLKKTWGYLCLSFLIPAYSFANTCPGDKCESGRKPLKFSLLCIYQKKHGDGYQRCRTAARFVKLVEENGKEVLDDSSYPYNPQFEVECDRNLIFNTGALRFTDEKGTRIQVEPGPYPAMVLPRGALGESHKYTLSHLELEGQSLSGYCYIYNTPFLMH